MHKKLAKVATLAGLALLLALPLLLGCGRGGQTAAGKDGGPATIPPEFNKELAALDGSKSTLAQYQGKVVLVNFWATWCGPCQEEIPWLIELNRKYASKGFVVVGIAMDDEGKKAVEPYVQTHPFTVNGKTETMNYPVLLGTDNTFALFGGGIGLPTSMLYARDGRKVMTKIGSLLIEPEKFTKLLEAQF